MQVVCIYSGVSPFEQKLDYIFNIFKNTLNEIGVNVTVLDITKVDIPYYNGIKQPNIETIFNHMKNAQGIIFATTAQRFAVNGAMQVFLEHLDYNLYKDVLKDKPCMSIITSSDSSEYMAGNYINMLIGALGGTNINNMLVGKEYLTNIEIDNNITEIIEKYAEDYYRMVKQNRKYFVANPFKNNFIKKPEDNFVTPKISNYNNTDIFVNEDNKPVRNLTGAQVADLYKKEIDNNNVDRQPINNFQKSNISDVLKQYKNQQSLNSNKSLNSRQTMLNNDQSINNIFNSQDINNSINNQFNNHNTNNNNQFNNHNTNNNINNQDINNNINNQFKDNSIFNNRFNRDDDISHIAKLLGQKYEQEASLDKQFNEYIKYNSENHTNISASMSSLKQKTQSLYHYFQPQLANGINIVIQISISGKENFNVFLIIQNGECICKEGMYPSPDVTIISDSIVWEEVLNGKSTLQKAFMLGRLKVKGNFVIISKFEQFFKII